MDRRGRSRRGTVALCAVAAEALLGCASGAEPRETGLTAEQKAAKIEDCWDAADRGDDAVLATCAAPDGVREIVDRVPAADGLLDRSWSPWPGRRSEIQALLVNGHNVVVVALLRGDDTAMLAAQVGVMDAAGRMTVDRLYIDQSTVLEQLGVRDNRMAPDTDEPWPKSVRVVGELSPAPRSAAAPRIRSTLRDPLVSGAHARVASRAHETGDLPMNRTLSASAILAAMLFAGPTTGCKDKKPKAKTDTTAPKTSDKPEDPEPDQPQQPPVVPLGQRAEAVKNCLKAEDEGAWNLVGSCYADDGELEIVDAVPPMTARGGEAAGKLLEELHKSFPDAKSELQFYMVQEPTVIAVYLVENDKQSFYVASYIVLDQETGQIMRERRFIDQATILAQSGKRPSKLSPKSEEPWPEKVEMVIKGYEQGPKRTGKSFQAYLEALNKNFKLLERYDDNAVLRYMPEAKAHEGKDAIKAAYDAYYALFEGQHLKTNLVRSNGGKYWVAAITATQGTTADGKPWKVQQLELMEMASDSLEIERHFIFGNPLKREADLGTYAPANK